MSVHFDEPEPTVEITVNAEARKVAANSTLADLVTALGLAPESTATAFNGEFVPRGRRADCVLGQGDRITCFQAIVGG